MPKSKKNPEIRYYLINIKLRSNLRTGPDAYVSLFEELKKKKVVKKTEGDKAMIIRTMHRHNVGNDFMLTGLLTKFTFVEGRDWVNTDNFEIEQPKVPKNVFPNPKEVMYYFVPLAHRFVLKTSSAFSPNIVVKFLKSALKEVISTDEQIEVNLEQDTDVYDKIFRASEIKKLIIEISYTNADPTEGALEFMDTELRESQIGKAKFIFSSDQNGNIIVGDNRLVKGAIELSQENGSVEATIVDSEDNKRKHVKTSLHPKMGRVEAQIEDNLLPALYNQIKEKYRSDGNE